MATRTGAGGATITPESAAYRPDAIEAPGGPPRQPDDPNGGAPLLAKGLGLFSLGLGLPQVLAPGAVNRLVGVGDTTANRTLMRIVGVRELTAAAGIMRSRKPVGWLWARVAGDLKDLALLGTGLARNGDRRTRAALGAVAGVMALDVVAAIRQTRRGRDAGMVEGITAITVNKPVQEVYARWRDFARLPEFMTHLESVTVDGRRSHWVAKAPLGTTVEWDAEIVDDTPNERIVWRSADGADVRNEGTVRFLPAPGGRGTEVVVELRYDAPGDAVGRALAKLLGEEPVQQMKDDLRRFKQVIETGEVVLSDASPRGTHARDQATQREAQPQSQPQSRPQEGRR